MSDKIIYQDGVENWHYRPELPYVTRGPTDRGKSICYIGDVLYVLDREQSAKIAFRVSRWKLAEIGLSCILAAFTSSRR